MSSPKYLRIVAFTLGVLFLLLGAGGCAGQQRNPNLPKGIVNFQFISYDGELRSLDEFRGQPLVVSVIATWAGPALIEVERLQVTQQTYGRDFGLLFLVVDERPEMAAVFAETFKVRPSVGRIEPPQALVGEKGPFGSIGIIPTSVLLDAKGQIIVRSDGPWPIGALEKALDAVFR